MVLPGNGFRATSLDLREEIRGEASDGKSQNLPVLCRRQGAGAGFLSEGREFCLVFDVAPTFRTFSVLVLRFRFV